jgi:uncharacterized protein (TIGR04255 family)
MMATDAPPRRHLLNVPAVAPAHYERNYIKQAVCELRFPTLYELEGPRPPASFARALRKEYPIDSQAQTYEVTPGALAKSNAHVFRSKRQRWSVSLKASAISLETTHYDTFAEFKERLSLVLQAAKEVIDSDFFTRIGLRYINLIEFPGSDLASWINPALVGPLANGVYGTVSEHSARVVGSTERGGFTMQHGLAPDRESKSPAYSLDFDFFAEDVPFADALIVVQSLHDDEFKLFRWGLGPAALQYLGTSRP